MFWFPLLFSCVDYDLNRRMVVDAYTQPQREAGVDIIWVIDDSASMFEEQEQLATHISHFTDYLTVAAVDFQLGVITTDVAVTEPGRLINDMILSPDTEKLAEEFADLVLLEEGSRNEQGFAALLAGLDSDGVNGAVLRTNSDLEIIFFSDEDDQSELRTDDFISNMANLRNGEIVVNAIIGDPPEGCASINGAADPGFKYQEAQELTLGIRESICSLEYDAVLERIALKVLGLENRFGLSSAPDLTTMRVLVDGAEIHRRQRNGWQYDAGTNSIVFDGFAVPKPGADIVFQYALWIGTEADLEAEAEAGDEQ